MLSIAVRCKDVTAMSSRTIWEVEIVSDNKNHSDGRSEHA